MRAAGGGGSRPDIIEPKYPKTRVSFSLSVIALTASVARSSGESRASSHGRDAPPANAGLTSDPSSSARASRDPLPTEINFISRHGQPGEPPLLADRNRAR